MRTIAVLALACGLAAAQQPAAEKGDQPVVWAMLLGGASYDSAYGANMGDWLTRMHALLTKKWGVDPARVTVLAEKSDALKVSGADDATVEKIQGAFEKLAKSVKAQDRFILFVVGYGQTNEPVGKLTLKGADLGSDALGTWLDRLPTRNIVILNGAGGGAEFQPNLNRRGRVVICAAGKPGEGNEVFFPEFLLRAYETGMADANADGKTTVLEAYNWSARETAKWYFRQYRMADGSWKVLGRESCAIWQKLYGKGRWKMAPSSTPNEPDKEPVWGEQPTAEWMGRRILTEHASLDDMGEKLGGIIWINKQFVPIDGTDPAFQGCTAKRVVLEQPGLIEEKR